MNFDVFIASTIDLNFSLFLKVNLFQVYDVVAEILVVVCGCCCVQEKKIN